VFCPCPQSGWTPLLEAISHGFVECSKLLLAQADVNKADAVSWIFYEESLACMLLQAGTCVKCGGWLKGCVCVCGCICVYLHVKSSLFKSFFCSCACAGWP